MKQTRTIALCGMLSALSVALMLLGALLGIGMYAGPMLAGLCLLPLKREAGTRGQWLVWLSVSLLSLMLVSDPEQNLMYIALFGLYPILYPRFQAMPRKWRMVCKLVFFNVVIVAVEALIILVLVPETLGLWMGMALLVMGNIVFLLYDHVLPVFDVLLTRTLSRFFH